MVNCLTEEDAAAAVYLHFIITEKRQSFNAFKTQRNALCDSDLGSGAGWSTKMVSFSMSVLMTASAEVSNALVTR